MAKHSIWVEASIVPNRGNKLSEYVSLVEHHLDSDSVEVICVKKYNSTKMPYVFAVEIEDNSETITDACVNLRNMSSKNCDKNCPHQHHWHRVVPFLPVYSIATDFEPSDLYLSGN